MANFLNRLQTFLFGAAIGRAASDAITPVLEPVRQHAWEQNQNKVLDPATAAEARAAGVISESEAEFDSARSGVAANRLGVLLRLAQEYPGSGELKSMLNREKLVKDDVTEALTRHKIPAKYHGAIISLFDEILTPGELAAAIHRGLVPDPVNPATGEPLLRGEQPQPPFKVEPYPVYDINATKEAAGSGYDVDRLGVLVGLQGLPMGTHEAAQAFFRGIITHGDYIRAFNESNSRNEWAQAVLDQTRQIPTARDFMENALRGHHDFDWAAQQAERHGMSREDAFLIYQNQGRPLNLHQITQAEAWGAKYNPGPGDNKDPWMQSVLLGAVRPEYYEMQYSLKYNLPSAFNFRALQEQNVITESEAETWYKRLGWPPELAKQVAAAYAKPAATTTKENPWLAKAQNRFWTDAQNAYIKEGQPRSVIEPILQTLVPDLATRDAIFQWWTDSRTVLGAPPPPVTGV